MALAASLLLPSLLSAQQISEEARAAAFAQGERFASCLMSRDFACANAMSYAEAYWESGTVNRDLGAVVISNSAMPIDTVMPGNPINPVVPGRMAPNVGTILDYSWMEVAEPWPPFAVDDSLYAFVPYFASFGETARGRRTDRMAYLIATSADDGKSWRFFPVRHNLQSKDIDSVIPGAGEVPRPEFRDIKVDDGDFARSPSLETTERRFLPSGEAYVYALTFEIRRSFATPVAITLRYDNPSDPARPLSFRGSLEPGQTGLRWQSPPLTGFETGQAYRIVIEGSDPETGSLLFEHRDELLLSATREQWLSVDSKPPGLRPSDPDLATGP